MNALPDLLMLLHFLWVLFMILGLPLGLWLRSPVLRWTHFTGITVTGFFAVTGMYCPLTVWEEALRWQRDPAFTYGGSFLVRYLTAILYPRIDPWLIRSATAAWAGLTLSAMVLIRPGSPFKGKRRT